MSCNYSCDDTGFFFNISTALAVFWGSLVSLLLIWATVLFANRMVERSVNMLLIFVVGGFILRLLIVFGVCIFVYYKTNLNLLEFFSGLFGSYIFLQVLEMIHLQQRLVKRTSSENERLD
ncbi:hypothetical protein AMJ80_04120 [bacterium SM23_31]|nr:MAG: hypothetical protein AMJ80_04120 [bacterium SM23_31]